MRSRLLLIVLSGAAISSSACVARTVPETRTPNPTATFVSSGAVFVSDLRFQPRALDVRADSPEKGCVGVATITLDDTPRGTYLTGAASFVVTITGCPAGTVLTNAYLSLTGASGTHDADAWIDANLADLVLRDGSGTFRSTNGTVPLGRLNAVLADPASYGIRVDTRAYPFGLLFGSLRAP